MTQRRAAMSAAGALFMAMSATASFAGEISPASAANMARNCFGCHGPNGQSPGAIPSLHGKPASFIIQSFKDFRSGARASTVMGRHAKGYTDEQVEALAKYIAGLK